MYHIVVYVPYSLDSGRPLSQPCSDTVSLGTQPRVKSLRSSYTGLYPQILHGVVSPEPRWGRNGGRVVRNQRLFQSAPLEERRAHLQAGIKNSASLGPYSRTIPREALFLISEVPLQLTCLASRGGRTSSRKLKRGLAVVRTLRDARAFSCAHVLSARPSCAHTLSARPSSAHILSASRTRCQHIRFLCTHAVSIGCMRTHAVSMSTTVMTLRDARAFSCRETLCNLSARPLPRPGAGHADQVKRGFAVGITLRDSRAFSCRRANTLSARSLAGNSFPIGFYSRHTPDGDPRGVDVSYARGTPVLYHGMPEAGRFRSLRAHTLCQHVLSVHTLCQHRAHAVSISTSGTHTLSASDSCTHTLSACPRR
jgi:hypothetical protein